MSEVSKSLERFARKLIPEAVERERFLASLQAGDSRDPAILWVQARPELLPWQILPAATWQANFVDRLPREVRAGAHALHQSGAYYCFDLSSAFAASPLLTLEDSEAGPVLDLCAAPGGKTFFTWRALQPSCLLANEVIGKRTGALISNLERCGLSGVAAVRSDSSVWRETAANCFSLVVADVPCSGQSLIAKGEESPGCFHPATINMNANRQRRIVANASELVSPGGHLLYMTCTYSREENEGIVEWLCRKWPNFSSCEIQALSQHRSPFSKQHCYRLWPFDGFGAGAFCCLLQNTNSGEPCELDFNRINILWPASSRELGRAG